MEFLSELEEIEIKGQPSYLSAHQIREELVAELRGGKYLYVPNTTFVTFSGPEYQDTVAKIVESLENKEILSAINQDSANPNTTIIRNFSRYRYRFNQAGSIAEETEHAM